MNGWLLFLVLASMPWRPQYWTPIAHTPVEWSNTRCHHARACYYDQTIYLQGEWEDNPWDEGLQHAVLHELQHHFLCTYRTWRTAGGWPEFERLVSELLGSGSLSQDQRSYLSTLLHDSQSHELHAELPWVLQGKIPPQFAQWYPWFYTKGGSRITPPQEYAPWSIFD